MWVTPGASTDSTCSSFTSPTFSNSRAPPPSRIGTTETTISSSRPAARYCCATDAPPPRDTSFSPAAARARSSADSIPSMTKWNVVPRCISSGLRGWLVRTKTGWWKGGLSPHQPFHDSSHGPGPPPNMFRPMMVAPAPPRMSSANGVLALTSPPSSPWLSRNALSGTSQSWSCSPPTPSGCSGDWCGPATKPSIDIVMFSFNLLIDPPSVGMLEGPSSASEVIEQPRSLTKPATTRARGRASFSANPSAVTVRVRRGVAALQSDLVHAQASELLAVREKTLVDAQPAVGVGVELGHPGADAVRVELIVTSAVQRVGEVNPRAVAADLDR